uniref:Transthyretin/hydroxyisourate hydrolase domain-containing protein n=1 Tax=Rousettus aegyptiacus TaxID=9407 RepID=A0A7J8ELF8_ROUAE|nr:hypothetical protein HJG63_012611 [Rousettus aegyptiacus]
MDRGSCPPVCLRLSCCGHKAEPHTVIPAPLMAQDRGMGTVSSPLTTHVLDTASGLPAQGLGLRLSRLEDHGQQWTELRTSYTDHDGPLPLGSCRQAR